MRARATGAFALAIVLGLSSCDDSSSPSARVQESTRPNVLVIMTDDQRADGTMAVMPATSALMASGGTTFTHAFATTPLCCPSRATVFTGRYAHNHGVLLNVAGQPDLLDQSNTVQSYLHRAKYRTGIFGKYLNGWDLQLDPPYFDEWAIFDASQTAYSGGVWNVGGTMRRVRDYSTTFIRKRAVDFVTAADGGSQPWLLFVTTAAPHEPFIPAPRYAHADVPEWNPNPAVREKDRSDKPPFLRTFNRPIEKSRLAHREQLRTLMSVDDLVASIGNALEATDQDENTLIFFISDNPYLWGEHSVGEKMLPYTQSIRIPFMVMWPGSLEAGARDDRLAATIDVAPTILDAVGIEVNGGPLDGRSLLQPWDRDRVLIEYWKAFARPTWAGIRTRSALYVEYYKADGETVTFREFYNLETDPWELENLLAGGRVSPGVDIGELHTQLAHDRSCAGESCP